MKDRKKPEKFLLTHGMHSDARVLAFSSRVPHKALKIKAPYKSWHYQDYNPIEYLWKKTKQRATHNQYFKAFAALTVSVDKALAFFATHADEVLGLFGRYCEESGLDLKQVA